MPGALGGTSSELAPLLTESGAGLAIQAEAAPIAGKVGSTELVLMNLMNKYK